MNVAWNTSLRDPNPGHRSRASRQLCLSLPFIERHWIARPKYAVAIFEGDGPKSILLPIRTRKMPKMKTKSGAKKRFSFTLSGKVKAGRRRK